MTVHRYSPGSAGGVSPARRPNAGPAASTPAAEALALRFGERLRLFALRRVEDSAAAEDVAQETLRRVLVALEAGRVRDVDALSGFVYQTATHICQHLQRSRARERRALDAYGTAGFRGDPVDALSRLVDDERRAAVRTALEGLGPKDRELLRALFYEGLDSGEVAGRFGITTAALRVRKHRALRRLERLLADGKR